MNVKQTNWYSIFSSGSLQHYRANIDWNGSPGVRALPRFNEMFTLEINEQITSCHRQDSMFEFEPVDKLEFRKAVKRWRGVKLLNDMFIFVPFPQ